MEVDRDGRGLEHPVAGAVMLEGADEADGDDGDAALLRKAEAAILKFVDMAVAGALGLVKNDEAGAAIDGVLRHAPHARQIGGAADVWEGDIAEALHEPTVSGKLDIGSDS